MQRTDPAVIKRQGLFNIHDQLLCQLQPPRGSHHSWERVTGDNDVLCPDPAVFFNQIQLVLFDEPYAGSVQSLQPPRAAIDQEQEARPVADLNRSIFRRSSAVFFPGGASGPWLALAQNRPSIRPAP